MSLSNATEPKPPNNRLTLEHAELLLQSDPTAAFELLRTYGGASSQRSAMLRAKALGLGISQRQFRPHMQRVFFAHTLKDGVILTISDDGTVAKTTPVSTTRTIAHSVAPQQTLDYADSRHLLTYACETSTICLLDIQTEKLLAPPSGESLIVPAALALSPSGLQLAAISSSGKLAVWRLPANGNPVVRYVTQLDSGQAIRFVDEHTLAALTSDHADIFHLSDTEPGVNDHYELPAPSATELTSNGQLQLIATGDSAGVLNVIDSRSGQLISHENVCGGYINSLVILPNRRAIGFACNNGNAGVWDTTSAAHLNLGHIEGGTSIVSATADDRYLLIGGNNGRLLIYDFAAQTTTSYLGHANRLTVLLPPSPAFPHIVSADATGIVRLWPAPASVARVAVHTTARVSKAILLPGHGPLIALTNGTTIPWYNRDGLVGELAGHRPEHYLIAISATQPRFAMYGSDELVELWSFDPQLTGRTLATAHGVVTAVAFVAPGAIIVGSRDGTFTEWSIARETHRDLGTIDEPIQFVRTVPGRESIVIAGTSGALWLANQSTLIYLGKETESITSVAVSRDAKWLAIGTTQGTVRLYDLTTRAPPTVFHAASWIEYLAFAPESTEIAIATADKVTIAIVGASHLARDQNARWHDVDLSVKYVSFSLDGQWLAVTCDRGDIWFYRRRDGRWFYLSAGNAKIPYGSFSDDSAYFGAADSSGRALIIDMKADIFVSKR